MRKSLDVKAYYDLYNAVRENPRSTVKQLAPALKVGGRGQKYSTVTDHVSKLYKRKISLHPNLVLRTYENCCIHAYFLKVKSPASISSAFSALKQNTYLSYMLLLSGFYDFFVTSRYEVDFGPDLTVMRRSVSYTPVYTVPRGWNCEVKDVLFQVAHSTLSKGRIEREVEDWLPWEDIHFRIYEVMKNNVQLPFRTVAERMGLSANTVRKYFYKDILPYCNVSHYFFPKGYDHYHRSFILVRSNYETGIVEAFSRMPCTTYFFPLEKRLAFIIFHEQINDLMFAFKKLEEKGYIEKYLLHVPLHWE